MSVLRCLGVFAFAAALAVVAGVDPTAPLPLPGPGTEAAAAAQHLLIDLAAGGSDPEWPEREAALPDATDSEGGGGLARRWQASLPAVLARLGGPEAARALVAVDRHCVAALAGVGDLRARLGIALDHLPAPSARAEVALARAREWDRGHLRTVVALEAAEERALAGVAAGVAAPGRDELRGLAGKLLWDVGADPLPLTGFPEPLREVAATEAAPVVAPRSWDAAARESGMTFAWAARPGWIFGLDVVARVAWQRALPLQAQVLWGDGGAVVRSPEGLLAIDESGAARALGPLPERARLEAVAGGAAWFALDARVWRVALPAGQVVAADLGEEPVGPPIACGDGFGRAWRSLWLTTHSIVWWAGDGGGPRFLRHGLPVGPGWRLVAGAERGFAGISAPDGRRWRLAPRALAEGAGVLMQARLANASGGSGDMFLERDPVVAASHEGRRVALQGHLVAGIGHVMAESATVSALAETCGDPVLAATARYAEVLAAAAGDPGLAQTSALSATFAVAFSGALAVAARAEPAAEYSRRPEEVIDDPALWRHALSATGLALVVAEVVGAKSEVSVPGEDWQWGLKRPSGWTAVECRDGAGNLVWRHGWPTDPSLPSRAMARRGRWLLVVEGQERLLVLAAATGDIVLAAPLGGSVVPPEDVLVLSPTRFAVVEPPGVGDHLVVFAAGGSMVEVDGPVAWAVPTSHALPGPARSLVGEAGVAVVTLADGRVLRY